MFSFEWYLTGSANALSSFSSFQEGLFVSNVKPPVVMLFACKLTFTVFHSRRTIGYGLSLSSVRNVYLKLFHAIKTYLSK